MANVAERKRKMDKLNLIKKEIDKSEEYGVPVTETRWFVETNDGFDGSAQGYGYKTPQALYKAYAYFKSKDQRKAETNQVKKFLKDNPDVKAAIDEYLSDDASWYRLKDGEPSSIEHLVESIKDKQPEVAKKLTEAKDLWREITKNYEGKQ